MPAGSHLHYGVRFLASSLDLNEFMGWNGGQRTARFQFQQVIFGTAAKILTWLPVFCRDILFPPT